MRAIVLESYGGPEVLQLRDVPDPAPGPEEVIVDVAATALNRADLLATARPLSRARRWNTRSRAWSSAARSSAVGERATQWKIGDEVMGIVGGGAYAEQIAVHERQLLAVPDPVGVARCGRHPRGVDHRVRRAGAAGRADLGPGRARARRRHRAWARRRSSCVARSAHASSSRRRPARSRRVATSAPTSSSTTRPTTSWPGASSSPKVAGSMSCSTWSGATTSIATSTRSPSAAASCRSA